MILFAQDKSDTTITDSSIIISTTKENGKKAISEILKNKNSKSLRFYYESEILEEQRYFDTTGREIGIWKYFNKQGKLLLEINHDAGKWNVTEKSSYPYKDLLDRTKKKGDEILKKWYGESFFKKYLRWNLGSSHIYDDAYDLQEEWTASTLIKPTRFLLRYDIVYDSSHIYNGIIEFEINKDGKFNLDAENSFQGLEIPSATFFNLSHKEALNKAEDMGLNETDSTRAAVYFFWERKKDTSQKIENGNFRLYVGEIRSIDNSKSKASAGGYTTFHYNFYVFNPWTGAFIEKRKMKQYKGYGTSELIPEE